MNSAVVQAERPHRGVEALDPERAEGALAPLAVAEGVLLRLLDRLLGDADGVLAPAVIALGGLEDFLVLGVPVTPRLTRAMADLLKSTNQTNGNERRRTGQPFGRKYFLMLSPSVLNSTRCRELADLLLGPLDHAVALAGLRRTSPCRCAVILKRFLAPDLVFSLGILLSCRCGCGRGQRPGPAGDAQYERARLSSSSPPRQPLISRAARGRRYGRGGASLATAPAAALSRWSARTAFGHAGRSFQPSIAGHDAMDRGEPSCGASRIVRQLPLALLACRSSPAHGRRIMTATGACWSSPKRASCDRAYRYDVTIAERPASAISGEPGSQHRRHGRAATAQSRSASAAAAARTRNGTGRLSAASGAGTWRGSGTNRRLRGSLGSRAPRSARRQHHDHLAAFEARLRFDLGDLARCRP